MTRRCCIRRTLSVALAMAAFALSYPGCSAQASPRLAVRQGPELPARTHTTPEASQGRSTFDHVLRHAEANAAAAGQQGVAVLLLPATTVRIPSQDHSVALLSKDRAVAYTMRHFDLVVLRQGPHGRLRLQGLQGPDEGVRASAADAFLDQAPSPDARVLGEQAVRVPTLVVFPTHGLAPIARAWGLQSPQGAMNFVASWTHASTQHPSEHYAAYLLAD